MAYRFKVNERGDLSARKILCDQIERARKALDHPTDPVAAIHEARKCLKRSRALLRLIEPVGEGDKGRALDQALRDVARKLSAQRDLDVMRETLALLSRDKHFTQLSKAFGALREALDATDGVAADTHVAAASADAETSAAGPAGLAGHEAMGELFERARSDLKSISSKVSDLALPQAPVAEIVLPGVEKTYRKGLKQRRVALGSKRDDDWHDWRKVAQAHWRQMNLVKAPWPDWFETRVEASRRLSERLGADHDLSLLKAFVQVQPKGVLTGRDQKRVIAAIEERQWSLRDEASSIANLLYALPAKALMAEIAAYWRVATGPGVPRDPLQSDDTAAKPAKRVRQKASTASRDNPVTV